jgi:hypothetical protein
MPGCCLWWLSLCWVSHKKFFMLIVVFLCVIMLSHYAECCLCWLSRMLSVLQKLFMLSVIILCVVMLNRYAECHIKALYAVCVCRYAVSLWMSIYWVLFMGTVTYAECRIKALCCVSLCYVIMDVIKLCRYECHYAVSLWMSSLCCVIMNVIMLSVAYGDCHLCWVSHKSSLCWVSLCCVSLCCVSWHPWAYPRNL